MKISLITTDRKIKSFRTALKNRWEICSWPKIKDFLARESYVVLGKIVGCYFINKVIKSK